MADDSVSAFVDELPVGIWVARAPGGELVYANKTFREILGIAARDDVAVGEYAEPYGICDRAGRPYPEERMPFVQALERGDTVMVDDIVIHRRDGRRVYIRATARPLRDDEGVIRIVSIAFSDITREVEAEVAMRRAQRLEAVGTLAGGVAHDFNNLLAGMRVVAETLAATEGDPTRKQDLERIIQAAESAGRLTGALLGFARQGRHRSEIVDVARIVASVQGLVARAVDRRVRIVVDAPEPAHLLGDPNQLEQVVMNLVLNAAEAMEQGGEVHVAVNRGDGAVVLEVRDSGPGIPLELRDRIFEPYFSTKNGTSRSGTGLGLAVVVGIVEAHHGAIEIVDLFPGTCMRVTLPAADGEVVAEAPAPAPVPQAGAGTILVVDDEALVRHAAQLALTQLGYDVIEASSGRAALEVLGEHDGEVDAIVLDLTMPDLDGAATFRAVRGRFPHIPIVLSSGYVLDEGIAALLREGLDAYLPKPYGVAALAEVLGRVLQSTSAA